MENNYVLYENIHILITRHRLPQIAARDFIIATNHLNRTPLPLY